MAEYGNKKRGADAPTPTPASTKDSQCTYDNSNYIKLRRLYQTLSFISIVIITIAYFKHSSNAGFFGMGLLSGSILMEIILNPIYEEDE